MSTSASTRVIYTFGLFALDAEALELRKSGALIKVPPQALTVLRMLVARRGELVTREEIQSQLWGSDTFVDFEQGLNHCIKQIRGALSDDAQSPRFVETLPRRGYRFIAPVETSDRAVSSQPIKQRRWSLIPVTLLTAVAFVAALVALWFFGGKSNQPSHRHVIAVLPFENMTGDPSQEFFSDGMTEELSSQIARLDPQRLGVISRTSAFKYKGTRKGADQIGRELNADYLVEGSLRQAQGRVRITAQLIRVSDQSHVWSENYERPMGSVLSLESDVANSIAQTINLNVVAPSPEAPIRLPDWRAYSAYLKGRHLLLDTKREKEIRLAIDYFKEAVVIDPAYAIPYAGLADAYSELAGVGMAPASAYALAKEAAAEALKIDPQLAEAHVSLGRIYGNYDWDLRKSEEEFRLAIASKPTYEEGYHSYSHLLMALGRFEEATRMGQRVLELDPLSPHMNAHMGLTYILVGHLDQAIAQLQKTIQLDSGYIRAYHFLGLAYELKGDYPQAVATLRKAVAMRGESIEAMPELAHALAGSGDRAEARTILRQLERLSGERYVSAIDLATIHLALGEKGQALSKLDRAAKERDEGIVYLAVDPYFKSLRSDPRFAAIVKQTRR